MKQIAYVLAGVLIGFILAGSIFVVTRLPGGHPITLAPSPTKTPIEVDVIGGVVRPGVYELPEGSRVKDAIEMAGGLLAETDSSSINLAAKLEDGQQLVVPGGAAASGGTGQGTAPFSVVPPAFTPTPGSDLIDLNSATVEQLDSLPGIGPTLAQSIVDYRTNNGPFSQIEDIMNVPGVGVNTFDQIRNLITVVQP